MTSEANTNPSTRTGSTLTTLSAHSSVGASVVAHQAFQAGEIDRRLFGSFVEHMGRSVYTGIFEPGHPEADDHGFRRDVLALTRELGVSLVRYPGGNFVSGYRWEDGIGPVNDRPTRLDLAWRTIETNAFGINEFLSWSRQAEVEPMLAVNLGTRGPQEAADLVEYVNYPAGTYLSDLRREHGAAEPYDVKLWCLGNEMDGPWQLGMKSPDEYGKIAAESAKMMRLVDPRIELVACGSSMRSMPSFARWESAMLEHCFDYVDYVSLHSYFEEVDHDLPGFLAAGIDMDRFIEEVIATVDHVSARKRSQKKLMLAFDEWNVWFQARFGGPRSLKWETRPRVIEDTYDVAAAIVVGSLLISLLRHADRVRIACQAQLANVIGAIRSEPDGAAWPQTTFFPFAHVAKYARGTALNLIVQSPTYVAEPYGDVSLLDTAATWDAEDGKVTFFMVNRSVDTALPVAVSLHGFGSLTVVEHVILAADGDPRRSNTEAHPSDVRPRTAHTSRIFGVDLETRLEPLSWNVIRLAPVVDGAVASASSASIQQGECDD